MLSMLIATALSVAVTFGFHAGHAATNAAGHHAVVVGVYDGGGGDGSISGGGPPGK